MNQTSSGSSSRRKLLIGLASAVAVTAAIIVMFVLPAEYAVDPTGIGKATGLIKISNPALTPESQRGAERKGVLKLIEGSLAPEPGQRDHWEVELGPYKSIEFKYTLPEGGRMAFEWRATAPVHYDMHAHPFEGGEVLTESYGAAEAAGLKGRYVAPFSGIHGWHWHNRTFDQVKLTLDASGALMTSTVFTSTGERHRPIPPGVERDTSLAD